MEGAVTNPVGFFSSVLNIGRRLLGIAAPVAAPVARVAAPIARRVAPIARRGAAVVGGGIAAGAGFAVGESVFGGDGGGVLSAAGGMVGGNGETFRRTIVQTIRADDGVVIKNVFLRGAPHLMQHDLVVAKKVFRLSTKLHQKMPKRTVRTSRIKLLTQQVLENALEGRLTPQAALCPPRCP